MNFYNPVGITMYPGARAQLVETCADSSVLLFASESMLVRLRGDKYLERFLSSGRVEFEHAFSSNPSLSDITAIAARHAFKKIDFIIGIGGGSTMDVAKISAVAIPAFERGFSLTELLDDNRIISTLSPIDCIQVPTTAGTGSEVTPFATVWDYEKCEKKSLSHSLMYAKNAYVDSELLMGLPIGVALSTGLDALNQALESLWNVNATEYTRALAVKAVVISLGSLNQLENLRLEPKVASDLALTSLFAGCAISQTRTAICHSISYPLTMQFGLSHGLACAFSMLDVLGFNSEFIKKDIKAIESQLGNICIEKGVLNILTKYKFNTYLREHLISTEQVMSLQSEMMDPSRAGNNIRRVSELDLADILRRSCLRASLS